MTNPPPADRSGVAVDNVIITAELARRNPRPPDHAAENRALVDLAQAMAESPQTILQRLADAALQLCQADSAGVSIEEAGGERPVFRWRATAGAFAPFLGGTMPRDFSPCGTALDRDAALLMADPARHFPYIADLGPPVREVLLVPFHRGETPVGTVWVVSHSDRQFDAEDRRLVARLSRFAATAAQVLGLLDEAKQARGEAAAVSSRLLEVEGRLRPMVKSATDYAIFSLGPDGKIATWNAGAERVFGWKEAEIVGLDGAVLFTPEDREAGVPGAEQRKAREEGRAEDERWHVRKDGSRFFASGVLTPIRDGELHGYAKVCRDVTDRRLAAGALRESEQRLRVALNAGQGGVWDWDIVTGKITWSDRVADLYGMRPGEFDGTYETFARHLHPDDAARVQAAVRACVEADAPYLIEYRIVRTDGEVRWIHTAGNLIRDAAGRPLRMTGAATDVTARKRAEEALRQSEARLRLLLESTNAIPWVADAQSWRFTYVGPQASKLLGYPADDWYAESFWTDHMHPDDRGWAPAFCRDQSQRSTAYEFDYRMVAADGRTVWLHDVVSVLRQDGPPTLLWGFLIDITARKAAEEEALRLRDQLARAARVTMLGELAAAIAHEINQPLCAIVSNAQAAQRFLSGSVPDPAEVSETLRDIVNDSQRASEVIGRVRSLLQKGQPTHARLDLNDTIREVVGLTRHQLTRKGIVLSFDLAADLPPVFGDRVQLQQVVLNLMVNAVDALDHVEAGSRELSLRSARDEGGTVVVSVRDSGPGIAADHLEQIFDALFTTKPDGMGIGLAISRSIVEAHGGRIWADPNARGATFHFALPVTEEAPP